MDPLSSAASAFQRSDREVRDALMDSRDPAAIRAYTNDKWATIDLEQARLRQACKDAHAKVVAGEGTLEEARAAGQAYAEAAYAVKTHDLGETATRREYDAMGVRAWMIENGHAATISRVHLYGESDPTLHDDRRIKEYVRELDKEVDDGRLDTHPWRNSQRTGVVAGLRRASAPDSAVSFGERRSAQDQLTLLRNPVALLSAEVEARKAGPGTAAADYHDRLKDSSAVLNTALIDGW